MKTTIKLTGRPDINLIVTTLNNKIFVITDEGVPVCELSFGLSQLNGIQQDAFYTTCSFYCKEGEFPQEGYGLIVER